MLSSISNIVKISFLLLMVFTQQQNQAQQVYVVGVEDIDYLPYYRTIDGQYVGFVRDILDDFAVKQGIRFEYKPLPIMRLYRDFYSQKIDLKFPDNPDWGATVRKKYALTYSHLFLPASDGLFVRSDQSEISVEELRSITSVLGFYPNLGFEDKIKDGTIGFEQSYDVDGALKQVISGRTDGAFLNVAVAKYHLRQMKLADSLSLAKQLPTRESAYALGTIKYPELVKAFDQYLIKHAATVEQLASEYQLEWSNPVNDLVR